MDFPQYIMIVEDEVITQRYLRDILGQHEVARVDCLDNAKDALSQVKKEKYDMILMDINIKGSMDGIQLAREILRTHTLPIVFITAHNDSETFQEVLELSPYGFIGKPFSSRDVEVAIQLAYKRHLTNQEVDNKKSNDEDRKIIMISDRYHYSCEVASLYCDDSLVKLNAKQNKLLEILSLNINNVVGYDSLVVAIWGDSDVADSALRTLVYNIRKILPDLPIVSHSKVGYSLLSQI